MRIERAAANRGAEGLLAYIRASHGSVPAFCAATGLDRLKVQKAIRGDVRRIDVDFAVAVESATAGAVPVASWLAPSVDAPPAA